MTILTSLDVSTTGTYRSCKSGFYAAEAGLEAAISRIMEEFDNLKVYTNSGDDPEADEAGYLYINNFNGFQVKYKIDNPLAPFLYSTILGASSIYHWAYTYDLESEAIDPAGGAHELLHERIRVLETPLTQFFVFYGGSGNEADLEWLPGPSMDSWGRVHSNGDVYIGVGNGNTLAFRNYDTSNNLAPHSLTVSGSIYRRRKNDGSPTGGTVRVKISSSGTSMSPYEDITGDITPDNWSIEGPRFNGYVLIGVDVYTGTNFKALERNGFYEQRAENPQKGTVDGIKIVGRSSDPGGIRVYLSRPTYTDVTTLVNNAEVAPGVPVTDSGITPNSIVQETDHQKNDCREGKPVKFTQIDLNLLQRWYVQYLDYQSNGILGDESPDELLAGDGILIYASRTPLAGYTPESTLHAIKIAKSNIPQLLDETTLATDNPVYIEGDFNTISQRGAVIIADAINILSNNWATAQAGGTPPGCTNSRFTVATTTTINAAFIAGNVPTPAGGGTYSGGLENYPRFHENWSGVNCYINGCFINLGASQQATGTWAYGSPRYRAPRRKWGWDINFQNPDYWPPFVPSFLSIERVGWKE
jgi:hypothetical protein